MNGDQQTDEKEKATKRSELEKINIPKPLIDILESYPSAVGISQDMIGHKHIGVGTETLIKEAFRAGGYDEDTFFTAVMEKLRHKLGGYMGYANIHFNICLPIEYSLCYYLDNGVLEPRYYYPYFYIGDKGHTTVYLYPDIACHVLRKDTSENKGTVLNKLVKTAVDAVAAYKHRRYIYEYNLTAALVHLIGDNAPNRHLTRDEMEGIAGTILPDSPYMPYIQLLFEIGSRRMPVTIDRKWLDKDVSEHRGCFYGSPQAGESKAYVVYLVPTSYGPNSDKIIEILTSDESAEFKLPQGWYAGKCIVTNFSENKIIRPLPYNRQFTYYDTYARYSKDEYCRIYIKKTPSHTYVTAQVISVEGKYDIGIHDFLAKVDKDIEEHRKNMRDICTMLLLKPVFDKQSYDELLRLSCRTRALDGLAVTCGYIRNLLDLR